MTYRIATGRDAGRKVVTLQTLPGDAGSLEGDAGKVGGSRCMPAWPRKHTKATSSKSCADITRPAISEQRLSISPQGRVRYQLKTPWRNGTTHVEWDAVDFIAAGGTGPATSRASHPLPRRIRPECKPACAADALGRGKRPAGDAAPVDVSAHDEPRSPEQKRRAMSWANGSSGSFHRHHHLRPLRRRGTDRRQHRGTHRHPRHPRPLQKHGALEQAHYRPAAPPCRGRVTRCRPLNRKRKQNPIRCGHDPAGLRSALCRDSVRNGYALSRCVARDVENPRMNPDLCPICAQSGACAAASTARLAKGRLNFLYLVTAASGAAGGVQPSISPLVISGIVAPRSRHRASPTTASRAAARSGLVEPLAQHRAGCRRQSHRARHRASPAHACR